MGIAIENAGAQRGFLLLPTQDQTETLAIEAQGAVNAEPLQILQSTPIDTLDPHTNIPLLSTAIVNYVMRTQESVILNDAVNEGQFIRDSYIKTVQPKSVLCSPLLNQGQLSGVLYLENNLTTGAFTEDRIEVLNILSGQAAISIQNARLYDQLEEYSHTLEQKVEDRTLELRDKNEQLAQTLEKLKATQAQIVAQEKLASLGALSAGVAHEIKNPLNFVNNFAALSVELVEELQEEIESHQAVLDQEVVGYIAEILGDLSQNATKITEHGKRADDIVRGMVSLSQGGTGKQQLTDINALLKDAINLAYHGKQNKDSRFEVEIVTEYDGSIEPLLVFPLDLNRAFLNMIDNACYTVDKKNKALDSTSGFVPTLLVKTINQENHIEVRIRDNGQGIPAEIQDKIFDPFFTTKPTNEGTGLGLSIVYDIIVQAHQGQIQIDSQPNEYTEFIVTIPKVGPEN